MTEDYPTPAGPPVPPPELVREWRKDCSPYDVPADYIARQAAAWGYQQAREDARRVEARAALAD